MEHIVELTDTIPPTPHDSPLIGGYIPGSDEGRLTLKELMDLCTTLSNWVSTLENELSSTKAVYHKAFITLTKRVKKLETQLKQKRSRAVIHSLDEEEPSMDIEDSPKHGRMIEELDKDEDVNLVSEQGEVQETTKPSKDDDEATLAETLLNIKRSTTKDKGKGIMQETELPKKIKKREMIQLSLDEDLAQKLYAEELAKEGGYKQSYFKGMKYEDIMPIFVKWIVPDEDIAIDAIPLATKPSMIVKYKIVKKGRISTYLIIRADRSTKRYTLMINLLENIDREDLEALWKLVKDKHGNTRPEEGYERVLWGDLKVMFEPNIKSEVWRHLQGYDVTVWKLFSSSGVHFVRFKNLHIFMLVDKAYPLTPTKITKMLERKLQADYWNEMCYQILKLMLKQQTKR
nr:hypothetical protein [Tanacetum cinerariifolium]